jgi:hypothetical protein
LLFQAEAQVNPTAQNTFLLGPHFSSFLVFGSIFPCSFSVNLLGDCFHRPFLFQQLFGISATEMDVLVFFSAALQRFGS